MSNQFFNAISLAIWKNSEKLERSSWHALKLNRMQAHSIRKSTFVDLMLMIIVFFFFRFLFASQVLIIHNNQLIVPFHHSLKMYSMKRTQRNFLFQFQFLSIVSLNQIHEHILHPRYAKINSYSLFACHHYRCLSWNKL